MHKLLKIFLICATVGLASCVSNKNYVLVQNMPKNAAASDTNNFGVQAQTNYKVQAGDVIFIRFTTNDEKINAIFAGTGQMLQMAANSSNGTPLYYTGYIIDAQGFIHLPIVHALPASGKSVAEVYSMIETEFKKYYKEFNLIVNLAEFKINIIGEVNKPGRYSFLQSNVNILELIATAGDLKDLANRKSIHIIRKESGKNKVIDIDLTQGNLINTEFYYLQPNDIVYVEPLGVRKYGNLTSGQNTIGFLLPLLSTALLVLNTYIILNK
ncbi:MAG: polysaccharide biosynthesis/export family protein [Bacteroidota bacterium]